MDDWASRSRGRLRLYAFGYDAFRLAQQLGGGGVAAGVDGLTGLLELNRADGRIAARTAVRARRGRAAAARRRERADVSRSSGHESRGHARPALSTRAQGRATRTAPETAPDDQHPPRPDTQALGHAAESLALGLLQDAGLALLHAQLPLSRGRDRPGHARCARGACWCWLKCARVRAATSAAPPRPSARPSRGGSRWRRATCCCGANCGGCAVRFDVVAIDPPTAPGAAPAVTWIRNAFELR